jgi:hypothetical protein
VVTLAVVGAQLVAALFRVAAAQKLAGMQTSYLHQELAH